MTEGKVSTSIGTCTTFQWEVDVCCFKDKNYTSDEISSPSFSTVDSDKRKSKWKLVFYPASDSTGYAALYLFNLSMNKMDIDYSFSLLTQDDKRDAFFIGKGKFNVINFSGASKFVVKNFFLDKRFITGSNKVVVECKISTEGKIEEKDFQNVKNLCRLKEFDKFEKLLTNEEFSDVTVITDGKNLYLHKFILTACSDVFEAMFRSDMKEKNQNEIEIKDIEFGVLQEFFRFIYTGKVNNLSEIVCELLIAAEKYCIIELKTLCEEAMCIELSKQNAVEYLNLAIMNNAEKLKEAAINMISLHLEEFTTNPEFETFEKQHPGLLLRITKKYFAITQKKI